MTMRKFRFFALYTVISGLLAISIAVIYAKLEERETEKIISAAAALGAEIFTQDDFIKEALYNTGLTKETKVKIFVGPYDKVLGGVGFFVANPQSYYIFLDIYFYNSLSKEEKEALIAHELGHIFFRPTPQEQIRLDIEHRLRRMGFSSEWRNKVLTKYQIKADGFGAKKTSVKSIEKLLEKVYKEHPESLDYRLRTKNLQNLPK